MSSKNNRLVEIEVRKLSLPPYLSLAMRHFEKAPPSALSDGNYLIPLDLLRMCLPPEYVDQLESVEIHFTS